VTTFYSDDPCVLARYEHASDASFDYAPAWLQDAIATAFKNGAARMAIAGGNPALLAGQDPAKVSRANIAASKAAKRIRFGRSWALVFTRHSLIVWFW